MSDSAPDNLEAAIAWIRAQAPLLYFGRASIEILAHNGKITRIITSVEVSTAAGLPNDKRGETNGTSK